MDVDIKNYTLDDFEELYKYKDITVVINDGVPVDLLYEKEKK